MDHHVSIAIDMAKMDAKTFDIGCRAIGVSLRHHHLARILAMSNLVNYIGDATSLLDAAKIEAAFPEGWTWQDATKDEEE